MTSNLFDHMYRLAKLQHAARHGGLDDKQESEAKHLAELISVRNGLEVFEMLRHPLFNRVYPLVR